MFFLLNLLFFPLSIDTKTSIYRWNITKIRDHPDGVFRDTIGINNMPSYKVFGNTLDILCFCNIGFAVSLI